MNWPFYILAFALVTSCVNEKGPPEDATGTTTGTTTGGTTGTTTGGTTGGTTGTTAIDPLADDAWHLENTAQSAFSTGAGVAGEDINVADVHSVLGIKGSGIKVAISDDGLDWRHTDLMTNNLTALNRNYGEVDPANWHGSDPTPTGDDAHGTAVAGLIAALGWNNLGSRGVAPEASFAGFRYLGQSPTAPVTQITVDLDQQDGDFDIFNYSYGYSGYVFGEEDDAIFDSLESGVTNLRGGLGTNYVQSAGNEFFTSYDACDPNVDPACTIYVSGSTNSHGSLATPFKIIVGATNADREKSSYSTPGSGIWVSAPGGEYGDTEPAMVTTDIRGCLFGYSYKTAVVSSLFNFGYNVNNLRCDYLNTFNGTSAAAPVVSGVIALMLEQRSDLTWRDVKHILAETSDKIDDDPVLNTLTHPLGYDLDGYIYDEKWVENQAGYWFSNWYGFGRVNAGEAVAAAEDYVLGSLGTFEQTKDGSGWFYDSGTIAVDIPADGAAAESDIFVGHNLIIESVQIELSTTHGWPGELAIHLVSPMGTESRLLNINSNVYGVAFSDQLMMTNAFYGEQSHGSWKIKVYDGGDVATGDLTNWRILISGHKKPDETGLPHPPTGISMPVLTSLPTMIPEFTYSAVVGVPEYEASIGLSVDDVSLLDWQVIPAPTGPIQLNVPAPHPVAGTTYYLKLRSKNGPLLSYPQVFSWQQL